MQIIMKKWQNDVDQALSIAQKAVFAEPERPDVRRKLASLTLQKGEATAALATLDGSTSIQADFAELRMSLALHSIALCLEAGSSTDRMAKAHRLAQKNVMLSPWEQRGWETLAYVRSRCGSGGS